MNYQAQEQSLTWVEAVRGSPGPAMASQARSSSDFTGTHPVTKANLTALHTTLGRAPTAVDVEKWVNDQRQNTRQPNDRDWNRLVQHDEVAAEIDCIVRAGQSSK